MEEVVKLEKVEGTVVVTLNRPKFYNAFNLEMIQYLAERLLELATDQDVKAVVITGEGKVFCAGGDLKWVAGFG
ncbi:MAG: enoyl-CoA hydratase/isomerase family protein, partial [Deltaproteobacteria bacterium]